MSYEDNAAESDAQAPDGALDRYGNPADHPSFNQFVATISALRAPDGCPWDREQTHVSISHNMIEDAYEAVCAIEEEDVAHLREELGDVLLQVVLQSQIAAALLAERGVVDAEVSYYKSAARVKYDPAIVTPERLEQCVKNAGYGVGGGGLGGAAADAICAAAVILLTWLLTRYAKPGAPVMSAGMSLLQVLLLGMVTSVHCLGMCGGIAMAQGGGIDVGRGAELRAAAAYNLGRVAAYTAVGALCGGLGAAISYGAQTKSMVFTLAGAAVALMGVNLSGSAPALRRLAAQLLPRRRRLPKGGAPLIAGLATGLMP